jgi:hypothetical protein
MLFISVGSFALIRVVPPPLLIFFKDSFLYDRVPLVFIPYVLRMFKFLMVLIGETAANGSLRETYLDLSVFLSILCSPAYMRAL